MMKPILDALRRFKVLWVALTAIVCVLYGYLWLMSPSANPNPREKVTIRGVFPFDRGLDLRFHQTFYARSPLCEYTARAFLLFPQARVSREVGLPYFSVKRTGGITYEAGYFRDQLLPGFCEWTPGFVQFAVFSGNKIVQGAALLGFPKVVNTLTYVCFYSKHRTASGEAALVCLQEGRGALTSKTTGNEVNFLWKESEK